VINPGSVSIPKNGSAHSYMLLTDGVFTWHSLGDGGAYDRFSL
jgi:predicted phosphodiesterase